MYQKLSISVSLSKRLPHMHHFVSPIQVSFSIISLLGDGNGLNNHDLKLL